MQGPLRGEPQRRTFERTARAYDRYRPRYPAALIDDLRVYAALRRGDRILEIGCGPGTVTVPIATWGHPMVCVEPSEGMVEVAREHLSGAGDVEFVVSRFEDAALEPGSFALCVSAQAFHWIDKDTGPELIARALRPRGAVGLIWNHQYVPESTAVFFHEVQDCYARHAPDLRDEITVGEPDPSPGHELAASGDLFTDLQFVGHRWQWTLPSDDYCGLLATHSPHAALPDEVRDVLLADIKALIHDRFDGTVTEHYVAELFLARTR